MIPDISAHGGIFGGGNRQKRIKYRGTVDVIHTDTSYHRFALAKDYAYSLDTNGNYTSVVNLITGTNYGAFTNPKQLARVKASSHDDTLIGFSNGLVALNKNMSVIWDKGTADGSNYAEWPCVALTKNFIFYLNVSDNKIYKIRRSTGALVAVTTATFYNSYTSALSCNDEETELYYTYGNGGQLSITIINANTMAVVRTILGNDTHDQTLGTFKKGNTFYVLGQYNGLKLTIVDGSTNTATHLSYKLIDEYNLYTHEYSVAAQVYKDGIVANGGASSNHPVFIQPNDNGFDQHSPFYLLSGAMKMTDKRWIQVGYDKKIHFGTII